MLYSPVLSQFENNKETFLITDWSAEGIRWIIMQPADDKESLQAAKPLIKNGVFKYNPRKYVARLQPIFLYVVNVHTWTVD